MEETRWMEKNGGRGKMEETKRGKQARGEKITKLKNKVEETRWRNKMKEETRWRKQNGGNKLEGTKWRKKQN